MVDTTSSIPINPYLQKFENKPKQVLSHEVGAGSLCLKCDCPGLDLHFWRKICKICHCRMDDHDVIVPEEDHGDIIFRKLFGNNEKFNRSYENSNRSAARNLDQKLQNVQLSDAPSPKSNGHNGSSNFRNVPLNPNSPISKIQSQLSPIYANLSKLQRDSTSSPSGQKENTNNGQENGGSNFDTLLKFHRRMSTDSTTSSLASLSTTISTSNTYATVDGRDLGHLANGQNGLQGAKNGFGGSDNGQNGSYGYQNGSKTPQNGSNGVGTKENGAKNGIYAQNRHGDGHNLNENGVKSTQNGSNASTKSFSSTEKDISLSEFTWVPSGSQILIEKYMLQLPEAERPIAGTEGAQIRRQRLAHQLPYHDCDSDAAKSLITDNDKEQHKNFVEYVKENVVGIGELFEYSRENLEERIASTQAHNEIPIRITETVTCKFCKDPVCPGEVGIVTDHGKPNEVWHPSCFKCETCEHLLVDLLYFFKDGQYHCGRHFGEKMFPRCSGCDELIFAKEYTFAEEKSWHVDHFCCFGCDKHLGGHRYIVKDDHPFCIDCYMDKFARTCHFCNNKIAPFDTRVSHKEYHWHAQKCFKCKTCEKNLANMKFLFKNDHIFCCIECKNSFEANN